MVSEIGLRAAEELRRNAYQADVSITYELECLGTDRFNLYQWDHGKATPGGKILAKMLKMGYDINYILLGVKE